MWTVDHSCVVEGYPETYHLGNHNFYSYQDAKEFVDRQLANVTEAIRANIFIMGSRNRVQGATAMDATGAQHFWKIERVPSIAMEGGG